MYDFPKRITLCRLMRVIFSTTIRTGERVHSPKPNSLFAFQTYTVADSKKNRSQFLRFVEGLRSQFLRFGGGLRSQFLRFGGGLRSQFLRFTGGLRSQFLRFGGGLRSQVLDLRSQVLGFETPVVYTLLMETSTSKLIDSTAPKVVVHFNSSQYDISQMSFIITGQTICFQTPSHTCECIADLSYYSTHYSAELEVTLLLLSDLIDPMYGWQL